MTKKKDRSEWEKQGRPNFEPSPAQLKILEDSFRLGAKVKEALAQAQIPQSTFYKYLDEHPDFMEQVEWWQAYPIMLAKHSVISHIKEDGKLALEYLKAKCKDEFGTRTEITGADGEALNPPIINIQPIKVKDE